MANEAYRAVFLRVHPTGKMVLSLTTESDGRESEYARLVADELGVPALDVKVVPADTDRFGVDHGFNASPSAGTPAAISSATGKILAKAALLAGAALDMPAEALRWTDGAFVAAADGEQARTIADLAMYAHGTGVLPPGIDGGLDAQTVYRE
ncbi:MAG: molybdopterin cofactor-binding domain-containing protein [Solirubrobacteraceae bacterium]